MPEYLTCSDPSEQIAAHAVRWLTDKKMYDRKQAELDELASRFAKPGATRQAAEFVLQQMQGYDSRDANLIGAANNVVAASNKPAA